MTDPGKDADAIVKALVCGDEGTIQLHGQRDERGVGEGQAEFAPQPGGALQKRGRWRRNGEGDSLKVVHGVVEPRRAQAGLEKKHIPDFVEEESGDMHLE